MTLVITGVHYIHTADVYCTVLDGDSPTVDITIFISLSHPEGSQWVTGAKAKLPVVLARILKIRILKGSSFSKYYEEIREKFVKIRKFPRMRNGHALQC